MRLTALDEPTMTSAKKDKGEPAHVRDDRRLEEWHVKRARLHFEQRAGEKNGRDDAQRAQAGDQLDAAADAVGFLLRDFQVIIREPKRAEVNHGEKDQPDEAVIRTRPENARDDRRRR